MVSTRSALLLALRDGPGYGKQLIRRLQGLTGGLLRLPEGSAYPALRQLETQGLVRSWAVVPGRRRGARARTYYELSERGITASQVESAGLQKLAALVAQRPPDPAARERMGRHIELGAELSEAAEGLALRRPLRGGRVA